MYSRLTLRDLAVLAEERAIRVRPDGCAGWISTSIQAIPRPSGEGKCRSESVCFPPTVEKPKLSASARKVPQDAASSVPKMKRPRIHRYLQGAFSITIINQADR